MDNNNSERAAGNVVSYELPAGGPVMAFVRLQWHHRRALCVAIALGVLSMGLGLFLVLVSAGVISGGLAAGLGVLLFGLNTITYETPVAGTTAPTATQSRTHQTVSAVITGDGATATFTVTHNWNLSAADLAAGYPNVGLEYLLAAGYTAASVITSKSANAVAFSCTAFTGAGLRVRLSRPWSALK